MKKIIFILAALTMTLGTNAQNLKFGVKRTCNANFGTCPKTFGGNQKT
jgi:hypothetical protein